MMVRTISCGRARSLAQWASLSCRFREPPDGLQRWFHQADGDHDGVLTVRELQRDAERFFHSLDVRHDGEIDPEDITR